jgi:hypothetical protein
MPGIIRLIFVVLELAKVIVLQESAEKETEWSPLNLPPSPTNTGVIRFTF